MLARLRVAEYALIEDVTVEFGPGLNVLTGETGAGKSILVESLNLLLGARASADAIRSGADQATVEGLFVDGEEETLVRREIRRDRTNRCTLDGELATARMLQERAERWVELHGQHEDQLLLKPAIQRALLDAYAGAGPWAAETARLSGALAALEREREALAAERAERSARLELLREQVREVEAAGIAPEEEAALAVEAARLRTSEERRRLSGEAAAAIEDEDRGLDSALGALQRGVDRLAALDPAVQEWANRVAALRTDLQDLARETSIYAGDVDHDAARAAEVEARRDGLFRLKRKYGASLEAVLEEGRAMREEMERLERETARGARLAGEREGLRAQLSRAAGALADAREAAAAQLAGAVGERLAELGMGEGTFDVALERRDDPDGLPWRDGRYSWSAAGLETVAFLIAPGAGEPLRPLARIASGGELSRVLLALKATVAEVDDIPTLVFDEIDAGIGGVVAHHVARQLRAVAHTRQVIVVTHLAQIAAAADRHLVVGKRRAEDRTVISVAPVSGDARVAEVSRLLGGDPERDVSRRHAEELLAGRP